MSETIIDRIEARAKELRIPISQVSERAGLNAGYLRDLRRKGSQPGVQKLQAIARVLDTTVAKLTPGEARTEEEHSRGMVVAMTPIVGIIEAGSYRDVSILDQDDDYPKIPVPQNELFPDLRQYVLEVRGDSMDKVVLEGTYVVCVPFIDTRLSPKPGMVVHVERSMADGQLVETTLKEIEDSPNGYVLAPRSSNSVHKPIPLDGESEATVEVKGLVVSLWKPLPKRW